MISRISGAIDIVSDDNNDKTWRQPAQLLNLGIRRKSKTVRPRCEGEDD